MEFLHYKVTVYVPSRLNYDIDDPKGLIEGLARAAGGLSSVYQTGRWVSPEGTIVREGVMVHTALYHLDGARAVRDAVDLLIQDMEKRGERSVLHVWEQVRGILT